MVEAEKSSVLRGILFRLCALETSKKGRHVFLGSSRRHTAPKVGQSGIARPIRQHSVFSDCRHRTVHHQPWRTSRCLDKAELADGTARTLLTQGRNTARHLTDPAFLDFFRHERVNSRQVRKCKLPGLQEDAQRSNGRGLASGGSPGAMTEQE